MLQSRHTGAAVSRQFLLIRYFGIILTLLQQEAEQRYKKPLVSIISLLEPLALMVLISTAFWFLGRSQAPPLGTSPILFFATGIFPHYLFLYVSRQMRRPGTTTRGRFPIERRLDHVIAHMALRVFDYSILGVVLFGGIWMYSTPAGIPDKLGPVLFACATIVSISFAWGMSDLVIGQHFKMWPHISPAIGRSMMLVSGEFFLPDLLPPTTRYVLSFNPLLHAVSLFRTGFYPGYPAIVLDMPYLISCSVFAIILGLIAERALRRMAEQ
jgi:capsular polysaccharide transport system permease protein